MADETTIAEIRARWAKATHPLGAPGSIARQAEDDFRVVFAAIEERDAEISQLRERVEKVQRERDAALERAERTQSEMAAALELATRQRDAAERSCAEAIERGEPLAALEGDHGR